MRCLELPGEKLKPDIARSEIWCRILIGVLRGHRNGSNPRYFPFFFILFLQIYWMLQSQTRSVLCFGSGRPIKITLV